MRIVAIWLGCLGGMALGLWIDSRALPLEVLASLCAAGDSPWRCAALHWTLMPAAHGLMLAGALAPAWWNRCEAVCAAAMVAGMSLGGAYAAQLGDLFGLRGLGGLLMAMVVVGGLAAGFLSLLPWTRRQGA